ncbi:DinB family protein [Bacillus timonensis]|nr:DinB family protein [Bacillus timonensis]
MNTRKEDMLKHQLTSIEFVQSLYDLSDNEWRSQVEEGKWTVAEIIGHLIPWDEFVIHQRLPYLFSENELPIAPNPDELNEQSAAKSRNEAQHDTLVQFVSVREALYREMLKIEDEDWERKFLIGSTELTLADYFSGLAQHDLHHFEQINKMISDRKGV